MARYNVIKSAIDEMDTDEIVALHNEYCENSNHMDDYIYSMNEFDEIMQGREPWEIARCAYFGNFKPCDDYFRFNGYANLESFDYWKEETSGIYTSDIAQYIDDTKDDLNNDTIADILAENSDENDD